jgi:hypothetical protein
MAPSKNRKIAASAAVLAAWPLIHKPATRNLRLGLRRWREQPAATTTDAGFSLIGQAMFWTVGQDFIGVGMMPKWLPGLGHKLAPSIQRRLPQTATIAWAVKVVEIASDATKIPIEGKMFAEEGFVPDGWAYLITQPLWSWIEAVEKIVGVILHPERVNTSEQVSDSISSIYGTWTRNGLSLLLMQGGRGARWRNKLGRPQPITEPYSV